MKFTTTLAILASLVMAATTTTTLAAPISNRATKRSETAQGEFEYSYDDHDGGIAKGRLIDPKLNECIDIPEVHIGDDDDDDNKRAFYPYNRSNAAAVVFADPNCEGTPFYIPPGTPTYDVSFYFASVKFEKAL
ncbi:hypothetical protein BGW42_000797 [Actinomortierella wolfii]|nr:hypothetical protein BGW42_000797 [Actinomortierella wolfii]